MASPIAPPIQRVIHPNYALYIGESPLNDNYLSTHRECLTYKSHLQRRDVKSIGSIEGAIISARDSTTSLKFDGHLKPNSHLSAIEIGKDKFTTLLA
jgi:hypothetical protein